MQSIPLTVAASSRTPCPCKHIPFIINKHIRIRLQQHYYTIGYYEHHINTSIMRNRNEWLMMTRTYTPHSFGFFIENILSPKLRKIWQGLCPYFWYFLKNAWSPLWAFIWPELSRFVFLKVKVPSCLTCRQNFFLRCRRRGPWLGGRDLKFQCQLVDSITPWSTLPFRRAHRLGRLIGLPGSQH